LSDEQWLLIGTVAAVGVLHTVVPDHWVPITVVARQRGWTRTETARAALQAGTGHVLSTLAIALLVWVGGVALASRFGSVIDTLSSLALIAFGLWIAATAWYEQRHHHWHEEVDGTAHHHGHGASNPASDRKTRTALLLILGSSPMLEGIPAFFAASKFGPGQIGAMAVVFAASTIATYVGLCLLSSAGSRRGRLGAFEQYGETLSGLVIAAVGAVFWIWPPA
jgi:hypothetical protein